MIIQWKRLSLAVAGTFRTAKAVRTNKETLWVSITHDNTQGWGEAAPIDTYHQNLESAEATLQHLPKFTGRDPRDIHDIVSTLVEHSSDQLATVAAIDAALHDWLGKKCGMPNGAIAGAESGRSAATSFSLGIDEPQQFIENVRRAEKYPILKSSWVPARRRNPCNTA